MWWLRALLLAAAVLLIGLGSALPIVFVHVETRAPTPSEGAGPGLGLGVPMYYASYATRSVADCALRMGDLRTVDAVERSDIAGVTWVARLVLIAALVAICLVALGGSRAAAAASLPLLGAILWLFLAVRSPEPSGGAAGWTAYPPLSTAPSMPAFRAYPEAWQAWSALLLGALFVAASAWVRGRPRAS
jgi:hypothetical protein